MIQSTVAARPQLNAIPVNGMTWREAYDRHFADGNAGDWDDLFRALPLIKNETLVILRLDRQNRIWAFRLFRTPEEKEMRWDSAFDKVNDREPIPSVYRLVVRVPQA